MTAKRWIIVSSCGSGVMYVPKPPVDERWTNDVNRNLMRLLRADAYHIQNQEIDETADAYWLISCDADAFGREAAFVKRMHERGAKVVVCFSQDGRFMQGDGLMNSRMEMYTDVTEHADVIVSGFQDDLQLYGRHTDKVMAGGCAVERLNFSNRPFEERTIDLLMSGPHGEQTFPFSMEICHMIKRRFPGMRLVYSIGAHYESWLGRFRQDVEFSHRSILELFPDAKAFLNCEIRPRSCRPCLEAFMYRVPAIISGWTYHSRLFPDFAYHSVSHPGIVDLYAKLRASDYHEVMAKAEALAEEDYFENFYARLSTRLWGEVTEIA